MVLLEKKLIEKYKHYIELINLNKDNQLVDNMEINRVENKKKRKNYLAKKIT